MHERSDRLGSILQGWKDEIERAPTDILRRENLAFLYLRALGVSDGELPIRTVFDAIQHLSVAKGKIVAFARSQLERVIAEEGFVEAAGDRTGVRTWLALKANLIRRLEDFQTLVDWLRETASHELRLAFEEVVGWPLVQAAGAFVHGAWAKEDTDKPRWTAWIEALDRAREYAKEFRSPNFGAEIAKAKSIIMVEYLNDPDGGLRAIDDAERDFGSRPILQEQRANVYFQRSDDKAVLEIFAGLERSSSGVLPLSDPFAYRRVAISAARLGRWKESADFYIRGIETVSRDEFSLTRIGLLGDAAFALSKAGEEQEALTVLSDAIEKFIHHCPVDIEPQWAALRAALAAVAMGILRGGSPTIMPGMVSSPNKPQLPENPDHALATQLVATMCAEADARIGRKIAAHVEAKIEGATDGLIRSEYAKVKALRAASHGDPLSLFLARANEWADEFLAFVQREKPTQRLGEESRWGFVVAAAILADEKAESQLGNWISEAQKERRADQLAALEQFRAGIALPQEKVRPVAYDSQAHLLLRAGACFRLLRSDQKTVVDTAGTQALLLSTMANGLTLSLFPGIRRQVVAWLAKSWQPLLESAFMFNQPRLTLPPLRDAVELALQGRCTLSRLTSAITNATGLRFGPSPAYLEGHRPPEPS